MDAPTIEELRAMSVEDLEAAHDQAVEGVQARADMYLDELHRRDMWEHSRTIRNLTWAIAAMTLVVTAATIVNVVS